MITELLDRVVSLNNEKNALEAKLAQITEELRLAKDDYRAHSGADPRIVEEWNTEHEGPISNEEQEPKSFEREKIYD